MNIDTSTAIYLGVALIGGYWAVGKMLMRQFEKRLDEKFVAQASAREVADKALNETLQRHLAEEKETARHVATLERDFLTWKSELPVKFVLREDYIRGQVTLEAKQDALRAESKVIQMQLERLLGKMEGEVQ